MLGADQAVEWQTVSLLQSNPIGRGRSNESPLSTIKPFSAQPKTSVPVKLKSIRVRNFRTVGSEQTLDLERGLTIVGPNSTGKTNLLRAVEMLFTGVDNRYQYNAEHDLTFGENTAQTGMIATFEGVEGKDKDFFDLYKDLNQMLEAPKEIKAEFLVYLYFTKTGTPVYKFFSNETIKTSQKAQFSRKQIQALTTLFDKFVCHYVPSSKSVSDLYASLLLPFVRRSISNLLQDKLSEIDQRLAEIACHLDTQLKQAGLPKIKSSFTLPNNSLEQLLSHFDFKLADPHTTSIDRKGMGIQAASVLSSFLWITREESNLAKSTIWLVEEPESYLHPELAGPCSSMLEQLRAESLLITTTHSLGFVPRDPRQVVGTSLDDKGRTKVSAYKTYIEATANLRKALGVRFSDYYNLGILNCFVEGKSDREVLKWALDVIDHPENGVCKWPHVNKCEFLDFTGVSGLEGFLKATYAYMYKERVVVVLLDGDTAGAKTRANLQQYFGQHQIPFQSNSEFISLHSGFSLEGLFPHQWIIDLHEEHPTWFSEYSVDVTNTLQPFTLKHESNKSQLREALIERAKQQSDLAWASRFIEVFQVLESCLEKKAAKLGSS